MRKNDIKWIPIDDELPYQNEVVLVSTKNGFVQLGYLSARNIWHVSLGGLWNITNDVTAWIKLPEPYREYKNEY